VSLAAGISLGVAAGLVNAFYVWQLEGRGLAPEELGLPLEMRAAQSPWSRTPIFLTSVLAHTALGAALGAVLGFWRAAWQRADAERRVLRETVRDAVAILFLCVAAYASAWGLMPSGGLRQAAVLAAGLFLLWAISRLAAWLLATGLESLLRRAPLAALVARTPWRTIGSVAGVALIVFALVPPLLARPSSAPAAPSRPAPPGAANVILLVLDTTRADRLSAYGCRNPTTPEIDRIAREGVLYEQAVSAGVWTLPGHAGIFTGAPSSVHGANGARLFLDSSMTTLAEILSRSGYVTAGFSNNPWVAHSTGMTQGFQHFEDHWRGQAIEPIRLLQKRWEEIQLAWHNVEIMGGAEYTLQRVLAWIEEARSTGSPGRQAPFFVFVNLMEPHQPGTYRPGHTDLFRAPDQSVRDLEHARLDAVDSFARNQSISPEQVRLLRSLYDGELRFVDHHVGAFVRELQSRGVLEQTLFVLTGDHGEAIGDHGKLGHFQSVHEELVRVPLILRHPRLSPGRRVATRVQTFDLFRTIVEFTGISEPLPEDARLSRNLLEPGLLSGAAPPRPIVAEEEPSEWMKSLVRSLQGEDADVSKLEHRYTAYYEGDLKYVRRSDGRRELYDLGRDAGERLDLASRRPVVVKRLERALDLWLAQLPAHRIDDDSAPREVELDEETKRALRALGYAE
jgi:arylsulfatase A-like enzyme